MWEFLSSPPEYAVETIKICLILITLLGIVPTIVIRFGFGGGIRGRLKGAEDSIAAIKLDYDTKLAQAKKDSEDKLKHETDGFIKQVQSISEGFTQKQAVSLKTITTLTETVEAKNADIAKLEKERDTFKDTLDSLNGRIDSLQQTVNEQGKQIATLKTQLEDKDKEKTQLQQVNRKLKATVAEVTDENTLLRVEKKVLLEAIALLGIDYKTLKVKPIDGGTT